MKLMTLAALTLSAFLYSPATHAAKPAELSTKLAMAKEACNGIKPNHVSTMLLGQKKVLVDDNRKTWNAEYIALDGCSSIGCHLTVKERRLNPQTHQCDLDVVTDNGDRGTIHLTPGPLSN